MTTATTYDRTKVRTCASSYRGPNTPRLHYHGDLTPEHYVCVAANQTPNRPWNAARIAESCHGHDIEAALDRAIHLMTLPGYKGVSVHVQARGWGYPDFSSQIWPVVQTPEVTVADRPEEERKVKYSKNGWPITKARHGLGGYILHPRDLDTLLTRVSTKYGVEIDAEQPLDGQPHYYQLTTKPTRLSMERFAQLRAYIEGYVDGTR